MSRRFVAFVDPPALQPGERATESRSRRSASIRRSRRCSTSSSRADAARARIAAQDDSARRGGELDPRRGTRAHRAWPTHVGCGAAPVDGVARPRPAPARKAARPEAGGRSRPLRGPRRRRACASTPRPRSPPQRHRASAPLRRLPESAQRCRRPLARRRNRQRLTRPPRHRSRRLRPRSKPHRRRWRRNAPTFESSRRALRGCAAIQWRSRRRSARCRRACARPTAIATSTGWSTRSLPRWFSSPCSSAAFWALRPRQRRRARWFEEQARQQKRAAAEAAAAGATVPAPRTSAPTQAPAVSQHPSQWAESGHAILPVTAPATIGGLEVTTVLAPQSHYARMAEAGASANAAAASVTRGAAPSMEELIDLEQQAEFYVVLGQDEAAIALLTAHLSEIGAASPLPFLQLLEIHQRRGDRAAYEAVREDYQRPLRRLRARVEHRSALRPLARGIPAGDRPAAGALADAAARDAHARRPAVPAQ